MDTKTMQERLQKIIARAGVTSRRAAEELITAGRVRVNGRVITELGAKADPRDDKVEVDGRRITAPTPVYVILHKPRNVVSTMSDPEGRPSVAELLASVGTRIYPVGRLDFATSGVLLATNDGEFSQGLLHPKKGVPKTYVVKVSGLMDPDDLARWQRGVDLEDGRTQPADVHFLRHEEDKTWFEITIKEGRNQQLRRMGEATGFPVMRLARVAFAGITNDGLRPGQWRHLTATELMDLRKEHGVPRRVRSAESGGKVFGKVQARGEQRGDPRARRDDARPPRRDDGRPPRRDAAPREEARPRSRDDARPPRRDAAPREEARPQRRDDARPPRRDAAPREDSRTPRRDAAPRDDARPQRRDGARPARRDAPPRDDARQQRRDAAPREGTRPQRPRAPR